MRILYVKACVWLIMLRVDVPLASGWMCLHGDPNHCTISQLMMMGIMLIIKAY